MTILSLTALSRLAERLVRQAGQEPVPVEQIIAALANFDIDHDRAHAGIRLSEIVGRLVSITDDQGRPCVRIPHELKAAA